VKLLMIICSESRRDQAAALLEEHGVRAFTELPEVVGEGATGKRFGSRVWPGRSSLLFTVAEDAKIAELIAALRACRDTLFPGEGMKVFALPAEEAL
jgi:hypothetical protein